MGNDSNSKPITLAIQAGDKNGVISGSGTLALQIADKSTIKASFDDAGNGKTKVTLSAAEAFAIFHGDNLSFEGHADLDPRTGAKTAGVTMTFTVPNEIALSVQGQLGAGGPSGSVNLQISL